MQPMQPMQQDNSTKEKGNNNFEVENQKQTEHTEQETEINFEEKESLEPRYNLRKRNLKTKNTQLQKIEQDHNIIETNLINSLQINNTRLKIPIVKSTINSKSNQINTKERIIVQLGKIKKSVKISKHTEGIPCERDEQCKICHNETEEVKIKFTATKFKIKPNPILKKSRIYDLTVENLVHYNAYDLVALKYALKSFINNKANHNQIETMQFYQKLLDTKFDENNFNRYIIEPIQDIKLKKTTKTLKFNNKIQFWNCMEKSKQYTENWPKFETPVYTTNINILIATKYCTSLTELQCLK